MLKIRAIGLREVEGRVEEMRERLEDRSAYHRDVVKPALLTEVRRLFDVQGDPPWAPLKPGTVAAKTREGQARRILVRKGRLRQSYVSPRGGDSQTTSAARFFEFINRVPYAYIHEEGRGGVAERRVIGQVVENKGFRRGLAEKYGRWVVA